MKHYLDTRTIKDIHYTVKVGDKTFEFENGRSALQFAESARMTCSELTWDDEPQPITIELFPIIEEEEPEESEEEPAEDLEQLEKECEA